MSCYRRTLAHFRLPLAVCLTALAKQSAFACTVCSAGPDGSGVNPTRAGIYNSDFLLNAGLAALPFLIIALCVTVIHLWYPEPQAAQPSDMDAGYGSFPNSTEGELS